MLARRRARSRSSRAVRGSAPSSIAMSKCSGQSRTGVRRVGRGARTSSLEDRGAERVPVGEPRGRGGVDVERLVAEPARARARRRAPRLLERGQRARRSSSPARWTSSVPSTRTCWRRRRAGTPGVPKPPGVAVSAISLSGLRAGATTCSATRCSAATVAGNAAGSGSQPWCCSWRLCHEGPGRYSSAGRRGGHAGGQDAAAPVMPAAAGAVPASVSEPSWPTR